MKKELIDLSKGSFLFLFLLGLIVILVELFGRSFFNSVPVLVESFVLQFGNFSILAYVGLFIISGIFLFPTQPLMLASGAVFGFGFGLLWVFIAVIVGSTINFYLARKFRVRFFKSKNSHKSITVINHWGEHHGFSLILLIRLLGIYFNLISYASGLTKVKYRPYLLATVIGFLPYMLLYVYAGQLLITDLSLSFIYLILIFRVIVFIIFIIAYKYIRRNLFSSVRSNR